MNKLDYFLIALIFVLIGFIAVIMADEWQKDYNNKLMIKNLTEKVIMQEEHIAKLEYKQSLMQSDIARTGIYDKKVGE